MDKIMNTSLVKICKSEGDVLSHSCGEGTVVAHVDRLSPALTDWWQKAPNPNHVVGVVGETGQILQRIPWPSYSLRVHPWDPPGTYVAIFQHLLLIDSDIQRRSQLPGRNPPI
jgi:hypothetical protein